MMEDEETIYSRENFSYSIRRPQEDVFNEDEDDKTTSSFSTTCVSFVDDTILPRQKKLPKLFAQRLARMAVTLATITLFVSSVIAVLAFITWYSSGSSAAFGFAFDSFFTSLSSFMIIWRFWSKHSSGTEIARKETIATLVIASSLVLSAGCIFVRAYQSIRSEDKPTQLLFILALSLTSCVAFFILFITKYKVAIKMGSGALMTDAIDALSGGILAFSLVVCSTILKFSVNVWFLDSTIAMAIAAFSVIYGVMVLMRLIMVFRDRENLAMIEHYLNENNGDAYQDEHKLKAIVYHK